MVQPRPEVPFEDQLRRRWLLAIDHLGPDAALEDAAQAFALRFGCNVTEGRAIAQRAWRTLGLPATRGFHF